MNRWIWAARIFGITVLVILIYLLVTLQRRLMQLQQDRPVPTATTTSR